MAAGAVCQLMMFRVEQELPVLCVGGSTRIDTRRVGWHVRKCKWARCRHINTVVSAMSGPSNHAGTLFAIHWSFSMLLVNKGLVINADSREHIIVNCKNNWQATNGLNTNVYEGKSAILWTTFPAKIWRQNARDIDEVWDIKKKDWVCFWC